MKLSRLDPPRRFDVDGTGRFLMSDTAHIELEIDEQVTFTARTGSEYDVARKDWGYYATPSLNGRLPAKGLRPTLVRSKSNRFFICLVERGCEQGFADYLRQGELQVLGWLDEASTLARISGALES